jgi:hypothetical protein
MNTPNEIAIQLKSLGYQVFINPNNHKYAFFSDGIKIGYVQENFGGGYSFSTVHKPDKQIGTSFRMDEGPINKENAEKCFLLAPNWALGCDLGRVRKYTLAGFLKSYPHLAEFNQTK